MYAHLNNAVIQKTVMKYKTTIDQNDLEFKHNVSYLMMQYTKKDMQQYVRQKLDAPNV